MSVLDDLGALRAGDPGGMLATISALPADCLAGYAAGLAVEDLPSVDDITAVGLVGAAVIVANPIPILPSDVRIPAMQLSANRVDILDSAFLTILIFMTFLLICRL